jgi:hypothetical protein
LEPHEVLDHVVRRECGALEQELSSEGGAIEGAGREDVTAHGRDTTGFMAVPFLPARGNQSWNP